MGTIYKTNTYVTIGCVRAAQGWALIAVYNISIQNDAVLPQCALRCSAPPPQARPATNAAAPNKPSCIGWCGNTMKRLPPRLSMRPRARPAPGALQRGQGRGAKCRRQGFSLHAGVHCKADDRKGIEQLARYITRPAIANERLSVNREGNVVLKLKTAWRNGATHIVLTPMEFMQRLAALVPRPRLHLIRFHGGAGSTAAAACAGAAARLLPARRWLSRRNPSDSRRNSRGNGGMGGKLCWIDRWRGGGYIGGYAKRWFEIPQGALK